MNPQLRENKIHGSTGYPYCQYRVTGIRRSFQFPVHWHEEMELIYISRGQLQVNIGGADYTASQGCVLIVNPQQLHLMGSEDTDVLYHTLLFPLEFLSFQTQDALEQTVFLPLRTGQKTFPCRVPDAVLTDNNLALLDMVIRINQEKSPCYQLQTRLLLLQFLMEVLKAQPLLSSVDGASDRMQKELLEYIRMHYCGKITLEQLASLFHLSPKYLSRYFKEHFHLTLTQYIAHLRMNHARSLLEKTSLSVTEIAMQSGFSGVSFFIREFKRENGLSPGQWRNQQRQNSQVK